MRKILTFILFTISSVVISQKPSKIYKAGFSYYYSFAYCDNLNEIKKVYFKPPFINEGNRKSFEKGWSFSKSDDIQEAVMGFSFDIQNGVINGNQIPYTISYYDEKEKKINVFEATGLVEDKKNLFLHPPRMKFFTILEFSPFPLIHFPLKVGKKWESKLEISQDWIQDDLNWVGELGAFMSYKVIGTETIQTKFGYVECFKIYSESRANKIHSKLIMYYNERYGIISYNYQNYDGSKVVFHLEKIYETNKK